MTNQSTPPQAVGSSDGLGPLVERLEEGGCGEYCDRLGLEAYAEIQSLQDSYGQLQAENVRLRAELGAMCANFDAMRDEKNRLKTECARLLPERGAVGQLLCSVADNLGDMPVSDEWAAKTAIAAHDLLVRNDYFRA